MTPLTAAEVQRHHRASSYATSPCSVAVSPSSRSMLCSLVAVRVQYAYKPGALGLEELATAEATCVPCGIVAVASAEIATKLKLTEESARYIVVGLATRGKLALVAKLTT
ncbi:MAG: hypothetical protein ACYDFV_11920 [Vulcanimicrobiaceae bacterium]